jgi:hypothetical protein
VLASDDITNLLAFTGDYRMGTKKSFFCFEYVISLVKNFLLVSCCALVEVILRNGAWFEEKTGYDRGGSVKGFNCSCLSRDVKDNFII